MILSADELREFTGRRRSDAQVRALEHMGVPFSRRPDGSLVVLRSVVEGRLGGTGRIAPPARAPQLQP